MEALMDYVECLNTHWLAMVSAGMYTHIREICIIGLCFEESHGPVFHPTFASLFFTFSVLSVLAEYKPWPRSLKEPPLLLLYIYEVIRKISNCNKCSEFVLFLNYFIILLYNIYYLH